MNQTNSVQRVNELQARILHVLDLSFKPLVKGVAAIGLAGIYVLPNIATAQDSPWELRVGAAYISLANAKSKLWVNGDYVDGGEIKFKNNYTLAAELGYRVTPRLVTRVAIGVPPTTRMTADGTLTDMVPPLSGKLGKIKYGPFAWTLTYDIGKWGRFTPYAGGGINRTIILKETDGDISGLTAKDAWGAVFQVGANYELDDQWSLFFDVRKIFVKSTANGTIPAFGGPAAHASVKFDPLIVHMGVGYRF